jgi:cell division inhibitor SulA/protein ImuA
VSHPALWRGSELGCVTSESYATGFAALDAELPGGGWPSAALVEILPAHEGIGELRILGHTLARLSNEGRLLAWIAPPYLPYAPALQAAGIDLTTLLFIKTRSLRETLWAAEQALRSQACGAVLAWLDAVAYPQLRRLQLAAESHRGITILFRPPRIASTTTPAALRLSLYCEQGGLAVRILKRRGAFLARPLLLQLPAAANRVSHHVVDRPRFSEVAVRSLPAALSTV